MKKYQIILLILPFMLAGACSQDAPTVQSPPSPTLSLEEAAVDRASADEPPDATASNGFPSNEKQYGLLEDERSVMTTPDGEIGLPVEPPWPSYKEYQVVVNCYAVRDAAERFAADNNGAYPQDAYSDRTPAGWTLIDYLPGERELKNPFTDQYTEPTWLNAAYPGQTGYMGYGERVGREWVNTGYAVTGFGEDEEIVRIVKNFPAHLLNFDSLVVDNCYAVRDAVEEFAADNNGEYPSNLADATPVGDTVIDLLPGGTLLRNPYTFANTEPVDGAAAVPGQTGYLVHVDHTGKNVGYTIDGWGRDRLIITITAGTDGR